MKRVQRDFTKNVQYFIPILTLALGYFYGVSSSARETLSSQYPARPLVCPPAGLFSIEQNNSEAMQGPNDVMPVLIKVAGNLQLKGWDRKIPEAYGRVEGECKILAKISASERARAGPGLLTTPTTQIFLVQHENGGAVTRWGGLDVLNSENFKEDRNK